VNRPHSAIGQCTACVPFDLLAQFPQHVDLFRTSFANHKTKPNETKAWFSSPFMPSSQEMDQAYPTTPRAKQGSQSSWRIKFPNFSLTFTDHARNFSLTKLTCNSYFSLHFSRLILPYTDSLCYHYHILNHWEWKATEAWRK